MWARASLSHRAPGPNGTRARRRPQPQQRWPLRPKREPVRRRRRRRALKCAVRQCPHALSVSPRLQPATGSIHRDVPARATMDGADLATRESVTVARLGIPCLSWGYAVRPSSLSSHHSTNALVQFHSSNPKFNPGDLNFLQAEIAFFEGVLKRADFPVLFPALAVVPLGCGTLAAMRSQETALLPGTPL